MEDFNEKDSNRNRGRFKGKGLTGALFGSGRASSLETGPYFTTIRYPNGAIFEGMT